MPGCLGKVSDGLRKMSDGIRKVSDGLRKVSYTVYCLGLGYQHFIIAAFQYFRTLAFLVKCQVSDGLGKL